MKDKLAAQFAKVQAAREAMKAKKAAEAAKKKAKEAAAAKDAENKAKDDEAALRQAALKGIEESKKKIAIAKKVAQEEAAL